MDAHIPTMQVPLQQSCATVHGLPVGAQLAPPQTPPLHASAQHAPAAAQEPPALPGDAGGSFGLGYQLLWKVHPGLPAGRRAVRQERRLLRPRLRRARERRHGVPAPAGMPRRR